jgi:hypothetical protein
MLTLGQAAGGARGREAALGILDRILGVATFRGERGEVIDRIAYRGGRSLSTEG